MQRNNYYSNQDGDRRVDLSRIPGRRQQREFLRYDSRKIDDAEDIKADQDLSPGSKPQVNYYDMSRYPKPSVGGGGNYGTGTYGMTSPGSQKRDYYASTPSSPNYGYIREHPVRDTESDDVFPPPYSSYGSNTNSPPSQNSADYNRSTLSTRDAHDIGTMDRSTLSSRGYLDNAAEHRSMLSPNRSGLSVQEHNMLNSTLNQTLSPTHRSEGNISTIGTRNTVDLRSIHSNYIDLNRSALSSRSILSHNTLDNKSVLSRNTLANRSIGRSIETIPQHKQNGEARPLADNALSQSKHSLVSLSRSPTSSSSRVKLYGPSYGVHNSLVNLGFIALLCLILCVIALQLLPRLCPREASGIPQVASLMMTASHYSNTRDVAVVLCTLVVMLDMCCLVLAVLQIYFTSKLLKCSKGEER